MSARLASLAWPGASVIDNLDATRVDISAYKVMNQISLKDLVVVEFNVSRPSS